MAAVCLYFADVSRDHGTQHATSDVLLLRHMQPPPPQRAPALLLHQGGQRPPQVEQHLAPPPFYSPFAQGGLQQQQQQSTPSPHPAAMQQAQQQEALARQQSGAMARQHSDVLARQHSDAMVRQQSAQLQVRFLPLCASHLGDRLLCLHSGGSGTASCTKSLESSPSCSNHAGSSTLQQYTTIRPEMHAAPRRCRRQGARCPRRKRTMRRPTSSWASRAHTAGVRKRAMARCVRPAMMHWPLTPMP